MIHTFKHKLRMASLEDHLNYNLGLRPGMAVWLTRMAWDIAGQRNINLLAYRGEALLRQFISLLDSSAYSDLLDKAADSSPEFQAYLDNARAEMNAQTARAA
ncbi:hypothetical protein [Parahaliea mediterranea]|uniref:Uncharacterized protein n=1 Tax=Parahaliea mediterranea TaxID=651086 RepID=A0A939IJN2_9GAMM|nr:hypothetical protein [Parahaliea mediterranea]MBN7797849.1 hypothetical protein [Parahaliea mediterranea]